MRKLTIKSIIFLVLAITGVAFAVYSLKIKNKLLLVVSILFALVSADNIFCNLKMVEKRKASSRKLLAKKELPRLFPFEFIIIILIIFSVYSEISSIHYNFTRANYTSDIVGLKAFISDINLRFLFDNIIIPIGLLVIILMKFSRENRAKVSVILGVFVTLGALSYVADYLTYNYFPKFAFIVTILDFISFHGYFEFMSYMIGTIMGLLYGVIGIKSSMRKLAWIGIALNIPGLYFVIKNLIFIISVSIYGFAP